MMRVSRDWKQSPAGVYATHPGSIRGLIVRAKRGGADTRLRICAPSRYLTTCRTLETYKRDGRREGSYLDEESERLDLEGSANESTTISIATTIVANAIRGRTRVGTHTT